MNLNEKQLLLLEKIRKELHSNPELSGEEYKTQKRILTFLKEHCNTSGVKVGQTGVLAEFNGKIKGNNILIRGDIDALPITEINTFSHQSITPGVSHKCGHDGHTTILLGLALLLSKKPIQKGKVYLLFQPAEENGNGAKAVLADSHFNQLHFDYAFALHNLPGFPLHQIVVKDNEFTSNVKSVIFKLHGKTAHAAEPEKGYNPALAVAHILQYAEAHTLNNPDHPEFFLITPIHVQMGEIAYGISAGYAEVHLTIRSWSTTLMEKKCNELQDNMLQYCLTQNLKLDSIWLEEFFSNNNNSTAVNIIREAAEEMQLSLKENTSPFKWGEDFGLFTQKFKGAMFGIGAGINTPALHNPDYDYPDEITPTAVNLFHSILLKAL